MISVEIKEIRGWIMLVNSEMKVVNKISMFYKYWGWLLLEEMACA